MKTTRISAGIPNVAATILTGKFLKTSKALHLAPQHPVKTVQFLLIKLVGHRTQKDSVGFLWDVSVCLFVMVF